MRHRTSDFKYYTSGFRFSGFRLRTIILSGLLTSVFGLSSCKKDKFDKLTDNRRITDSRAASNVRIVNLAGYNQVVAQGDSLTNFVVRNPNSPDYYKYPGTSYFPEDGRLGKTWTVPQDLFDGNDQLQLEVARRDYQGPSNPDASLEVVNDYQHPADYYLLPSAFMDGQPAVVPVPRDISKPSNPDHIKIRIVNLSASIKDPVLNSSGAQEDLSGAVSLAYADGTPVDDRTTDVDAAKGASDYVEIPYGTYQFKVLAHDGRELPGNGGDERSEFGIIDPPTSSIPLSLLQSSHLVYAPIRTYQPGGVYTIVVTPQQFDYFTDEKGGTSYTYQNSFQAITDVEPEPNIYFRIQGANAFAGQAIRFRVNGTDVGNRLAFGESGDYANFVQGNYRVEAVGDAGEVVAAAEQALRPGQNYTAWLYSDAAGMPSLVMVPNDLSGTWYTGAEDDASFSHFQYRYFFYKRFLNLSVGNPFITFTVGDGQSSSGDGDNAEAGVNLQPGIPVYTQPYVRGLFQQPAYEIMAFRSKPEVVPGLWADDIPVLHNDDFVARPALYEAVGREVPLQEPGVYTVALIGKSGDGIANDEKARMMIVKHNK